MMVIPEEPFVSTVVLRQTFPALRSSGTGGLMAEQSFSVVVLQ